MTTETTEHVYTAAGAKAIDAARAEAARAAAAKARAEAEQTAAAARLAVEQQRAALDVERRRAEREDAARAEAEAIKAKTEKARLKAKAATERAARREERRKARAARGARPFVLAMMAACLAAAWPGQFLYFRALGLNVVMAATLTTVIEGMAWVGIKLTEQAIHVGRPAGRYRAMTWGAATVAAAINLIHGAHEYSVIVGVGLALASLGGPFVHAQYAHAESAAVAGISGDAVRLAVSRRLLHRKVWREARRLRAAIGLDLTPEAAWVVAWRAVHGADPGVTAKGLQRHHAAVDRVRELLDARPAEALAPVSATALQESRADLFCIAPGGTVVESAEAIRESVTRALDAAQPVRDFLGKAAPSGSKPARSAAPSAAPSAQVNPSNPPAGGRPQTPPARTRTGATKPLSPPARAAARESALTASEAQREQVRTWIADRIANGESVDWGDVSKTVAKLWGRGRSWYHERLSEVRRADGRPGLRVVDTATAGSPR